MDKQYFLELLRKYLKNEASDEEEQFLIKYYNLFLHEPDIMSLLSDEQKERLKKEINTSIWQNIERVSEMDRKIIPLKVRFLRIAAVAAVVIGVFVTGFLFFNNEPIKKPAAIYSRQKQKPNRFIVLPDGSEVILGYGGKLVYPVSFDGLDKREVYLAGKAFFDIKHINSKPFIVHTGKLETTVLGTAFNIEAIPGESSITVTVSRGRVKVSDQNKTLGIIIPNQQITYNKRQSIAIQNNTDAKIYTDWTSQNDLHFEDVSLSQAAKLLEERFKVKIIFSDPQVKSKKFTATFDESETLDQGLKIICEFNEVLYSYDKEKHTVIISPKSLTN